MLIIVNLAAGNLPCLHQNCATDPAHSAPLIWTGHAEQHGVLGLVSDLWGRRQSATLNDGSTVEGCASGCLLATNDERWLQAITELSWRSSTRLVIHFGDYPCHGKKYHGEDWEQYDRYPVGDPEGKQADPTLELASSLLAILHLLCVLWEMQQSTALSHQAALSDMQSCYI